MQPFAEKFQQMHPALSVKEDTQVWYDEDDQGNEQEIEHLTYDITLIPGLENLTVNISAEDEFTKLNELIGLKPLVFSDFLGGRFGQNVEVMLTRISKGMVRILTPSKSVDIQMNFNGVEITVSIYTSRNEKTSISFIASNLVGVRLQPNRAVAIISGLTSKDPQKLEADTRHILRSVLFDIEYTYSVAFEMVNLENLKNSQNSTRRRGLLLPSEPIRLMYKGYVPELIEYFHVAEKVDYLPFKYICYFHVLEYFMDKSAYSVVSRKVKQLLLSPDFHIRSTEYIANAINVIKVETEKNATDKIKIARVIGEFAQKDTIQAHLDSFKVLGHFQKDHTLTFNKPLKIVSVNFDSDQVFIDSVSRRIYAMRCSIVHSNPDFDESKAVPFLPTPKNIEFLRTEIELIKEISRTIIANSAH